MHQHGEPALPLLVVWVYVMVIGVEEIGEVSGNPALCFLCVGDCLDAVTILVGRRIRLTFVKVSDEPTHRSLLEPGGAKHTPLHGYATIVLESFQKLWQRVGSSCLFQHDKLVSVQTHEPLMPVAETT